MKYSPKGRIIETVKVIGTRTGEETRIFATYNFTIYSILIVYSNGEREVIECKNGSTEFKMLMQYIEVDKDRPKIYAINEFSDVPKQNYTIPQNQTQEMQNLRLDKNYKVTLRRKKSFKGSFIKFAIHTDDYTYNFSSGDIATFNTQCKINKILIQQLNKSLDVNESSKLTYELEFNVIDTDVEFDFEMSIFPSPSLVLKKHTAPKAIFKVRR